MSHLVTKNFAFYKQRRKYSNSISDLKAALWIRIGFNADLDTDPDPGFERPKIRKKFAAEKNIFFDKKLQFTYPPLGLPKGRLSSSRSLYPSKENIWHFNT
jgi:hypothetical protein